MQSTPALLLALIGGIALPAAADDVELVVERGHRSAFVAIAWSPDGRVARVPRRSSGRGTGGAGHGRRR